ncbi:4Fe-4S binding protein [Roseobacter sp.]|uniref:ferredoxin family protein n=1 Tax=Roseobacter sp. TaxID=1907202 RepID=UPI003298EF28
MTHIVTENCSSCRFTDCVSVCPVNCFHGDADRLYIDPDLCIDCGACIPKCPVGAIVEDIDILGSPLIELNAEQAALLPVIKAKQSPLPGADARRDTLISEGLV